MSGGAFFFEDRHGGVHHDGTHENMKSSWNNDPPEKFWSHHMYTFFMVAESFSFIALLIIVITVVFSRKVVRSPTWIHFCITWVMWTFSFLLPLFDPPPDAVSAICMIAAILRFAVYPLCACSMLALTVDMWCAVMWPGSSPQRRVLWLVIFPYMVYLPCLISGTLMVVLLEDSMLTSICVIGNNIGFNVTVAILFFTSSVSFVLQISTIVQLLRRHFCLDKADEREGSAGYLDTAIRLGAFGFITIVLFVSTAVHVSVRGYDPKKPHKFAMRAAMLMVALMPLAVISIFGSKMDIVMALMFWRRGPQKVRPLTDPASIDRMCQLDDV